MPHSRSLLVLHTWPGCWDLPSFDPSCLAAILYLQLVLPNKFVIEECTNPDLSPSGQLPYLSHETQIVSTFPSIVKYVSKLKKVDGVNIPDLDSVLSPMERATSVAWISHVSTNMGDIVAHMFYSLEDNWTKTLRPHLAAMQPIPQRYYLPDRIRASYRPRLEAAGLWNLPGIEQQEKKPFEKPKAKVEPENLKEKYVRVFERQKVEEKASALFDVYARLLGDKQYFFQSQCTTVDLLLAAHILLLIKPRFADPLLQTLLHERYPQLIEHSERVFSQTSPRDVGIVKSSPVYSTRSLFALPHHAKSAPRTAGSDEKAAEEWKYTKMRWGWFALAGASIVYYGIRSGIVGEFMRLYAQLEAQERLAAVVAAEEMDEEDEDEGEGEEVEDEEEDEEEEEEEEHI
ncbi:hypothetical protein PLEOSDRAFT_20363 [Pleurotus ostreatus PC15]|uniref:Mitochondrial outer membrane transport complex Sam37/metaxin N-terminal domain-containing protein n=1 Tax=Pleurotus ostreatus (strain PC15) TaxID=1137138 RepID=A0A067PC43_PLEO1|nr:hypothetical protein PLEOSDRAFT_20363 [Pleurotus ostreatus PC15]